MNHIQNLAHALDNLALDLGQEQPKKIKVFGVVPEQSFVAVVDRVVTVAARVLYDAVGGDVVGKQQFLSLIKNHECELALRVMELGRAKGIISSIEHICFNNETKNVEIYFRKQASFSSQLAVDVPPVYLGPFEEVCEVQQRQFAIVSRVAAKPVLATWHLAECVAVAGFDSAEGVGFLFHIDEFSRIEEALDGILGRYSFEYVVLGTSRKVKEIDTLFQAAGCKKRGMVATHNVPEKELLADSYWSRAVRLKRSIAIDLRFKDPLGQVLGYEPEINPFSAMHKREKTLEEAERFSRSDGAMQRVSAF